MNPARALHKVIRAVRHRSALHIKAAMEQFGDFARFRTVPPSCQFSIVSEDCWGGALYQSLRRTYTTPFVGLWVACDTYLDLIESLEATLRLPLIFEEQNSEAYPVARLGAVRLGFLHYGSRHEASAKFERRRARFSFDNVYYKVDFRAEWYTLADVERWNFLRLPNSVAFIDKSCERFGVPIHNALSLGSPGTFQATVEESLNAFCWWHWLKTGRIEP